MNPTLKPGEVVEFKFSAEELTPPSYTPISTGIEMELDPESNLYYLHYMPISTNIELSSNVLDISCGWYCININF